MIPDMIKKLELFLTSTVFKTQSRIYEEFFAKKVNSFLALTVFAKKIIRRCLTGF